MLRHFQENTQGLLCDVCRNGTFNKHVTNPSGCVPCICMGVTSQCRSTTLALQNITLPLVEYSANKTTAFILTAEDGTPLDNNVTTTTINSTDVIQANLSNNTVAYWQTTAVSGDLVAMYSSYITFTVYCASSGNVTLPMVDAKLIIVGRNGSRLEVRVPRVEPDQMTVVTVTVSEVTVTQTGRDVSRAALLLALTDVQAVLLPASFSPQSHTTT